MLVVENSWIAYKQDCLKGFPQRVKNGSAKLVFCDPPYNLNQDYDAYRDNQTRNKYLCWCRSWLRKSRDALSEDGTLIVMSGDAFVSELDVMCKQELKLYKRHQIIWHFTFGQYHQAALQQSHVHILYYTKSRSKRTFNADDPEVRVMSARQLQGDKRANPKGKLPATVWVLDPEKLSESFNPLDNTWLFSRICGTFGEKEEGLPNQLPLPLVERCVRLFSNENDLVVDPFLGTGTTMEVCAMLNRSCIGFDISDKCVESSRRRIKKGLEKQKARKEDAKNLFDK